jgi:hypothetical protein
VETASQKLINTINVALEDDESFDLPYAIRSGYYYHVAGVAKDTVEARPTIMFLRDYNGDGDALEFALFEAEACMGLQTTLIGYSKRQDRVIQYPIRLRSIEGRKSTVQTVLWADYLFNKKPIRGVWNYEIDYRGRGGSLDRWTVRYNPAKETFEGTVIYVAGSD